MTSQFTSHACPALLLPYADAAAGKVQLPKEQLRELVVTVESSLAQAHTEAKARFRGGVLCCAVLSEGFQCL